MILRLIICLMNKQEKDKGNIFFMFIILKFQENSTIVNGNIHCIVFLYFFIHNHTPIFTKYSKLHFTPFVLKKMLFFVVLYNFLYLYIQFFSKASNFAHIFSKSFVNSLSKSCFFLHICLIINNCCFILSNSYLV